MSHYLLLSRVARLVGQPRTEIQRMIHNGQLSTFDGMVDMNELLRVKRLFEKELMSARRLH